MKIKVSELKSLILKILKTKYNEVTSNLITDVIIFGELSGRTTHGIIRLLVGPYSVMAQKPTGAPVFIPGSEFSVTIDGKGNHGMLAASLAMQEGIKLAKINGIGIIGTRNNFGSSGCLTYYLEKITKQKLIGIIMAQSIVSTPPHGGIEPLFGTNPIAFGFPTAGSPLIFDMATSAITFGAILKAIELNQKLPLNVATDKYGNMTTDPHKAKEGATLPFDNSYKGAGLAMIIELLAGLFTGADFAGLNIKGGWGNLFIVLRPDLFISLKEFNEKMEKFIIRIKNAKTKENQKIRIPGENTLRIRDNNLKSGVVEIDDKILFSLQEYKYS